MKQRTLIPENIYTAQAQNGLNSIAAYRFRKFYKDNFLLLEDHKALIDLWYEKPFFGKVNSLGEVIYLSETNLKPLQNKGASTLLAVDFVADAFTDLQNHFQRAVLQKKIKINSSYVNVEPKTGWMSINKIYHNYLTALYDAFTKNYLLGRGVDKRIRNFNDFVTLFITFMRDLGGNLPFTRTGFIFSKRCSNQISGLMIDLFKGGHSTDLLKVEKFIKDDNFIFFRESAKNFGFMVDRNAPWRLIADLSSPKMREYMLRYGQWENTDEMIDEYYYKSYSLDIDIIKSYMMSFYNSYVSARPFTSCYVTIHGVQDAGGHGTKAKTGINRVNRQPITNEQLDHFYGPIFWLKIYLTLRVHESRIKWKENEFKNELNKVIKYYKMFDFGAAIGYINNLTVNEIKLEVAKMNARMSGDGKRAIAIQDAQDKNFQDFINKAKNKGASPPNYGTAAVDAISGFYKKFKKGGVPNIYQPNIG